MPGYYSGKRRPIAACDQHIAGSGSRPLEIPVQEHIGVEKEPHGSAHMLGRQRGQAFVIAYFGLGKQPSLA